MSIVKKIILALLLSTIVFTAFGKIYQYRDRDGNITYSDRPGPGSKPVKLPPLSITKPSPGNKPSQDSKLAQPKDLAPDAPVDTSNDTKKGFYRVFRFANVHDQMTFQNQADISVKLTVAPPLKKNDKVLFLFDGKIVAKASHVTEIVLTNVDRGAHQLQAQLLTASGQVLRQTPKITVYVQRAHINRPKRIFKGEKIPLQLLKKLMMPLVKAS